MAEVIKQQVAKILPSLASLHEILVNAGLYKEYKWEPEQHDTMGLYIFPIGQSSAAQ